MMKKLVPREVLERKLRFHRRWYWIDKIFRDYSHAISLTISVSVPTCLLILPTVSPELQKFINSILILVTLVGLVLSLIRTIFRFEEETAYNRKLLFIVQQIALQYDSELINDKQLVKKIIEIEKEEEKEVQR